MAAPDKLGLREIRRSAPLLRRVISFGVDGQAATRWDTAFQIEAMPYQIWLTGIQFLVKRSETGGVITGALECVQFSRTHRKAQQIRFTTGFDRRLITQYPIATGKKPGHPLRQHRVTFVDQRGFATIAQRVPHQLHHRTIALDVIAVGGFFNWQ